MFERFTKPAREAVIEAQRQAKVLGQKQITADHLLLGVLAAAETPASRALRELGVTAEGVAHEVATLGRADDDALSSIGIRLDAVRSSAESVFGPGALDARRPARTGFLRRSREGHLRLADSAKEALEQSLRQALELKDSFIGSEHLLLGLLSSDRTPAARTLLRLGVQPQAVRQRVLDVRDAA